MLPTIEHECSEFLKLSNGNPLLKNLPSHSDGYRKIKVRKRKTVSHPFEHAFNDLFFEEHEELRQRSIFANGRLGLSYTPTDNEPFYIFPINGYKFVYSKDIYNSTENYKIVFDKLLNEFRNKNDRMTIFNEILRYTYTSDNFSEAIENGWELIIYGIPYYYAIRKSLIVDYTSFFYE